jgi:hypothetical protein
MICASCFADSAESAAFCTRCGRAWPRSGAQTQAKAATATARAVPAYPARAQESQPRISETPVFRDPRGLRTWVVILLACLGAILSVRGYLDVLQLRTIDTLRRFGAESFVEVALAANRGATPQNMKALYFAVFFVAMIVFSQWIYRVATNARALSMHKFEVSPRMAVASNFIPVVNLWLPYRAMSEIWRASRNPSSWRGDAAGAFLGLWWALWLVSCVLGNISVRINAGPETAEDIRRSTQLALVWGALDIASVVMALFLVIRLTAYQMRASTGEVLHRVFE